MLVRHTDKGQVYKNAQGSYISVKTMAKVQKPS